MKEEKTLHQTIEKLSQMKLHAMAAAFQVSPPIRIGPTSSI
jgi:hypothetical protein